VVSWLCRPAVPPRGSIRTSRTATFSLVSDSARGVAERERVFNGKWANSFFKSVEANTDLGKSLRKTGYDPERLSYPAPVFLDLLDMVRRRLFPNLSPPDGYRQLGRWQLTTRFETTIGRVISKAFPLFGPERVIKGIEEFARSSNNFIKAKVIKEGERQWRIAFRHVGGIPADFLAGALEYGLEVARTPSTRKIVVARSDLANEQFDLEITW
jgi:uncharacterized protein (TIGR02265 family)